ncbi:MAG: lipopolysaccharide heptosyltransferase II [Candidatus Omnitrophota bacterium]
MNIMQLLPALNVGGVEKGTIEIARYLTLNGHKSVVVSGGGRLEKNLVATGSRHYKLPIGKKNPFIMLYCYFRLCGIIRKENIDIVHGRSRIPALTGYFASRSTHRAFITTAHGQYRKHFISRVMGWGKIVIVANDMMARYMKENFEVPLSRISVIPRGVDLGKFSFIPPSERKNAEFTVGMISRFTALKGHPDFLEAASYAARKMRNIKVILMGDASSAKPEYIKKIGLTIRRLFPEGAVVFKSSEEDVAEILKQMDVLVSANRVQEAFGRSVIEAQARGTVVVATKVGGVMDNVEDGVTGLLCESGNARDMADKITRLARDRALREKLALSARENVEKKYSLDKMATMTMKVYSQALNTKKILIFKMSSLGDIILSTPSIRALRRRFPTANIKVLVDARFRDIFENCPYINEVIACDFRNKDKKTSSGGIASRLRSEDFDISVDLQNNRRSHLLSFLSLIPERYGYDNGKLSFLLNRKISLPGKSICPVDHQAHVLGLLGIGILDKSLEVSVDKASEDWAAGFLQKNWLKQGQKLVAISLAASRRWATKNWGVSSFVELTKMLAERNGIRVILLGTGEDRDEADEFLELSDAKPIDAVGKTDVSQLMALIKKSDALVTGDSAPMHIAAALNIPFVSIFGPTDPERHLPPCGKCRVLYEKVKCAPCYRPDCHKNMECMKSVTPEQVYIALMEIMEQVLCGS